MGNPQMENGYYQEEYQSRNNNKYNSVSGASAVISLLFSLLSIVMIWIGADKKDRCPYEDMIPIFLIVYGSMTLVSGVMRFIKYLASSRGGDAPLAKLMNSNLAHAVEALWNIAVFAIFIMGCYYVFKLIADFDGFPPNLFCDDTAYTLAFSVVVATLGVFAFALGVAVLMACCCAKEAR